jgi:hypothetical protein
MMKGEVGRAEVEAAARWIAGQECDQVDRTWGKPSGPMSPETRASRVDYMVRDHLYRTVLHDSPGRIDSCNVSVAIVPGLVLGSAGDGLWVQVYPPITAPPTSA